MSDELTGKYSKAELEGLKDLNKNEAETKVFITWNTKAAIYGIIEWCKKIDDKLTELENKINAM